MGPGGGTEVIGAKETKHALWDLAEHEVPGDAKALSSGHVWGQSALCRTPSQAVAMGMKFRREGPSSRYVGVTRLR